MSKKTLLALLLGLSITFYTHAQTVVDPQITTFDVEWSPDGTQIATANPDGLVRIWDSSGILLQEVQAHPDRVRSIAWKPDGTQLASAGSDAYIHIWDTATGTEVASFVSHSGEGTIKVDWSSDGSQLVSLGVNEVFFWDTTLWQQIDDFRASATDIDWSSGNQLDVVVLPSTVAIWETTSSTFQSVLIDPDSALLREAARSPDGTRIIEGNAVGTIRLWDVATQTDLGVLAELNDYIRDLVYSPDGTRIAVALDSGFVHVLDANTGTILQTYTGNGPVLSVGWKPDSSEIAFVGVDSDPDPNNDLQIAIAPEPFTCASTIPAADTPALIDAIVSANSAGVPQTICLEAGTYTLTAVDNNTDGANGLPSVTGAVTLHGLGAGAVITRDSLAPDFRLLHVGSTGRLTLDHLTLSGGIAGNIGGGIYNKGGTVTLSNSVLDSNSAPSGGGLYIDSGGSLILTASTLSNNSAAAVGGGFYSAGSTTIDSASHIVNNSAAYGGGFYNGPGSSLSSAAADISANSASVLGGGLYHQGTSLTLSGTQITNNSSGSSGGGIAAWAPLTIDNNTLISGNQSQYGGGIFAGTGGVLTLTNSTVSGNSAGDDGGGLYSNGGSLTISSSQISTNTANTQSGEGGALFSTSGSVTLNAATISGNSAYVGGGLFVENSVAADQISSNTQISGNTASYGGGLYLNQTANMTISASDISSNQASSTAAGIFNRGTLTVSASSISDNGTITAPGSGGGIRNDGGSLTVTDSTLSNNHSSASSGFGGSIYSYNGSMAVSGGSIGSSSAYNGGGIYLIGGTLNLSSTLSANSAQANGGGLYIAASGTTAQVSHSEFNGNSALADGGAIWNDTPSTLAVDDSLLSSNQAGSHGGAVFSDNASTGSHVQTSCISANSATDTGGIYSSTAGFNASNNWWGAADGPSGAGTGSGDAINNNVLVDPILSTGCPPQAGPAGMGGMALMEPQMTTTSSPITATATLPYNASFEDERSWRASGTWLLDTLNGHSGAPSWVSIAALRHESSVLQPTTAFSISNQPRARLRFWQRGTLAASDHITLEVLPQNSATWVVLLDQSGFSMDWTQQDIDLSAYRGQAIQIRWRLTTGQAFDSGQSSVDYAIDDVEISSR